MPDLITKAALTVIAALVVFALWQRLSRKAAPKNIAVAMNAPDNADAIPERKKSFAGKLLPYGVAFVILLGGLLIGVAGEAVQAWLGSYLQDAFDNASVQGKREIAGWARFATVSVIAAQTVAFFTLLIAGKSIWTLVRTGKGEPINWTPGKRWLVLLCLILVVGLFVSAGLDQ